MSERLQKILSTAGVASRREAEKYISAGRVTVNGVVVSELGAKAEPGKDRIAVDGKELAFPERKLYVLLNKPVGYVTTMKDPQGRPVVVDLVKDLKERVYPVGRLDYNTEGLLLLTNDGEWANRLMHPRHEVEKEYLVRVRGAVAPEQLRKLGEGVELEDGTTAPAKAILLRETGSSTWISLSIHEGRYRQVRRMCEAVSLTVVRLKRIRYGTLELGHMKPGEHRLLTQEEAFRLDGRPEPPKPVAGAPGGASPAGNRKGGPGKTAAAGRAGEGKKTPARGEKERDRKKPGGGAGKGGAKRKPTPRNSPSSSR
jgi:23S rRNA pseudouridine2605 synthase